MRALKEENILAAEKVIRNDHIIGMNRILDSKLTAVTINKAKKTSFFIGEREFIDFASGAYLGLNKDIKISDFLELKKWGLRSSFSRISGQQVPMKDLEKAIAQDLGYDCVIAAQSISLINMNVFITLKNVFKHFIVDEDIHSTLKNGISASGSKATKFENNNFVHLEEVLSSLPIEDEKLIIIDGVYSMSGKIAELDKIYNLSLKYNTSILIDDAHGYGTLGYNGLGVLEEYNLFGKENIFYIGGFAKAFSNQIGFICIPTRYKKIFESSFNPGIFSGPSCNLNYIISLRHQKSIRSKHYHSKRKRLINNISYCQNFFKKIGIYIMSEDITPIIAVRINPKYFEEITNKLIEEGLYVKPAIFPVVKVGKEIIRITVLENHNKKDLDKMLECIEKNRRYFVSIN